MKRTQIQLDEATYEAVRRKAFEQGVSMASVVRETLADALGTSRESKKRKLTIEDFTFIGMGRDPHPPRDVPVSVDHDRWYAEAIASRWEDERAKS